MTDARNNFVDKCIRDRKGKLVIGQSPNLPIIVWAIALLLGHVLSGKAGSIAHTVETGAIFTWAWLELFQGVNYFRRVLGLVVLLAVVLR